MKKILIPIFMLFTLSIHAFDLDAYWEIGEVKIGGAFQKEDPKARLDFNMNALKFCFCDRDSGFNFSISPFYCNSDILVMPEEDEKNTIYLMTLLNAELSFNTLFKMSDADKYGLNLFASAHYVDPIVKNNFQINAGLEFSITSALAVFNENPLAPRAKLFSFRTGFRYHDRKPMFFCDIGVDLGAVFMAFTPKPKDWDEYKRKRDEEQKEEIKVKINSE